MEKSDELSTRQHLHANRNEWIKFLSYFLLATGVALAIAGITFFFAYNWDSLPKFTKIGLVESILIITVSFVIFTSWSKIAKQIILTGATFLIGTLFAVFGQIYQTGADAYDLFLCWTLFSLLWVIAIRFATLWLIFTGLLCTTIWLYAVQIVPDDNWLVSILCNTVTVIIALVTIIAEWLNLTGKLAKHNRWFISATATATLAHTTYLCFIATWSDPDRIAIPLLTTLLLFLVGLAFGWKQRRLFYVSGILFTSLVILVSLIAKNSHMKISTFFILTLISIVGTIAIISITSYLKKQWYAAEE